MLHMLYNFGTNTILYPYRCKFAMVRTDVEKCILMCSKYYFNVF